MEKSRGLSIPAAFSKIVKRIGMSSGYVDEENVIHKAMVGCEVISQVTLSHFAIVIGALL